MSDATVLDVVLCVALSAAIPIVVCTLLGVVMALLANWLDKRR